MATTTVKIKRSQLTPTPTTLAEGELAYSYNSGQLFIGGPNGTTVIPVSSGGGGGAVTSVNGQVGVVVLTNTDVGAAATVHTHVATDITDFDTAVNALIGTAVADIALDDLVDVDTTGVGDGDTLVYDAGAATWKAASGSGLNLAFTQLTDVPASYLGYAGYAVAVNATEDALEFSNIVDGGTY